MMTSEGHADLIAQATRAAALCPMTRTPDEQSAIDTVLRDAIASTLPADESSEAESRRQIVFDVMDTEYGVSVHAECESFTAGDPSVIESGGTLADDVAGAGVKS